MQGMLETAELAKAYIEAGIATFTLESQRTNKHITYRIRKSKDSEVSFVSLLTGSDNESSFTYVGLYEGGNLRLTRKSKLTDDSVPVRAFRYFANGLKKGEIAPDLKVFHSGKCGRCGRKLTVPSSIVSGLGPECAKRG